MRKSTLATLAVAILLASVFGLLLLFGYVGSSAARVRREHGLTVPSSARSFVCRGDAWMHLFSDSGAASAFEMASSDLPNFISQLKILQTNEGDSGNIFPRNAQYQIHRPWMSGVSLKMYRCASSTGDSLEVQIWPIDDAHVGVLLYTDWN
jgi:hypothetical protein